MLFGDRDTQGETNDDDDDELLTRGPARTISSGKRKSMPIPQPQSPVQNSDKSRNEDQKSDKRKGEGQKGGKKEKDNK